jgi:hypothetical protein
MAMASEIAVVDLASGKRRGRPRSDRFNGEIRVVSLSLDASTWPTFVAKAHSVGLTASARIRELIARDLDGYLP